MDRNRFDDLTRAMATGTSRRQLLKGALGGGAAAALGGTVITAQQAIAQETCAGSGEECEMVEGSCCEPYTCFEGLCDIPKGCVSEGLPCVDDFPCCEEEGLTCLVDGTCGVAAGGTDTLPETGIGDGGESNGWMGALAAGGVIAAAAAVLRRDRSAADDTA